MKKKTATKKTNANLIFDISYLEIENKMELARELFSKAGRLMEYVDNHSHLHIETKARMNLKATEMLEMSEQIKTETAKLKRRQNESLERRRKQHFICRGRSMRCGIGHDRRRCSRSVRRHHEVDLQPILRRRCVARW